MGMAASQARFLGLTARKNNVEFEGQQINQQRTTLSNESANYYNDLLGMTVPTPPSVDDYTKTVYTFEDGALTNTLVSLIPEGGNKYTMSYNKSYTDDFSLVSASSSVVTRDGSATSGYTYSVGNAKLRDLGNLSTTKTVPTNATFTDTDGTSYNVISDGSGGYYINKKATSTSYTLCSPTEIAGLEYYYVDKSTDPVTYTQYYKDTDGTFYYNDTNGTKVTDSTKSTDNLILTLSTTGVTNADDYTLVDIQDGQYVKEVKTTTTVPQTLTAAQVAAISTETNSYTDDEYLKTLQPEQIDSLADEEATYLKLLHSTYGNDTNWYVRYVKNATTNSWKPVFYEKSQIENNDNYDGNDNSLSAIDCYTIGSKTKTEEVKNKKGVIIEKDSTGRYISITIPDYDSNGDPIVGSAGQTYSLTTNTSTDQSAYNNAMNEYEFNKEQYDQAIQNINTKIEVIQQDDKNLELRLKQLDTEQTAISTELDAVKKVIEKNTESSFKTFG